MTSQTKLLILIAVILVAILFLYNYNKPIKNKGSLAWPKEPKELPKVVENPLAGKVYGDHFPKEYDYDFRPHDIPCPTNEAEASEMKKFMNKNMARNGQYKRANYEDGVRGNENYSQFDKFFEENNSLIKEGHYQNDDYVGNDETPAKYAKYNPGNKRPGVETSDIFRSEDYLPKEVNKDWFEVMPEAISVKNRHLINISKPIGIDTQSSTLKNPSYDLRGNGVANPKFVVSPWLQSSIEPDVNNKGFCAF